MVVLGAVVFPLADQRITVRGQGSIERRRVEGRQGDAPTAEILVAVGFGDRGLRFWPRIGVGAGFEFDRGAQLADRGDLRQLA